LKPDLFLESHTKIVGVDAYLNLLLKWNDYPHVKYFMVVRLSSVLKLLSLFCFAAPLLCSAQSIPAIKAKALDNSEIILPNPGSRQFLILIVGFSQKSGKLCEAWSKKISTDYHADTRIAYFSLPVLQSAPSLVRPMIIYGMRKGVPAQELRRFIPLYSNESDWKKFVNFSSPMMPT
jgi:hypothetical protein